MDLASPLACPPVAWRGGLLAATEVGQVFFIDGETGEASVTPFQPELTAGGEYHWLQPAVVGSGDASQFVVSDGAASLHLVELAAEPTPHLAAVKSVDVGAAPLASPLAVAGSSVFAGTDDGRLAAFALPELTPAEPMELGGRVVWGPHPVPDGLLMANDAGELILVGEDGAIRWQRKIDHGDLGGRPLVDADSALVLHIAGGLSRILLADGADAGFADLGQPAVAGPVPLGERVVVGAADGALLVVNRP